MARSRRTSAGRSRRTVGSPPVRRTRRTPSATKHPHQRRDLLEREHVGAATCVDAVFGHAVAAAVVAAIGHRHAQVVDDAAPADR